MVRKSSTFEATLSSLDPVGRADEACVALPAVEHGFFFGFAFYYYACAPGGWLRAQEAREGP